MPNLIKHPELTVITGFRPDFHRGDAPKLRFQEIPDFLREHHRRSYLIKSGCETQVVYYPIKHYQLQP